MHVPFRAAALAMQEVIAGRIYYLCPVSAIALPNIESNQVKPIAMLSKSCPQVLPKLATAHEQGLVDFDAYFWDGIFFPSSRRCRLCKSSTPLRSRRWIPPQCKTG